MSFDFSAVIGPVIGAASQGFASAATRKRENAARDWASQQWRDEMAYNTPKNQKQRLIDAGLNPALMYETMPQNTTQGVGAVPSTHEVEPLLQSQDITNAMVAAAQMKNIQANTDATNVQTKAAEFQLERDMLNADYETEAKKFRNLGMGISNDIQKIERDNREGMLIAQKKGFDLKNEQTRKFIDQMDPRFKVEMSKMAQEISNLAATNQLTKVQTKLNEYEAKARSEGWSYSDNILFRQIIGALGGSANAANAYSGAGFSQNTNALKAVVTLIMDLFN